MGLLATVIITGAILAILHFKDRFASDGFKRIDSIKVPINVRSGIEIMIAAFRQAEVEYIKEVSMDLQCVSANTFIDAIVNGTNCVGGISPNHAPIDIFDDATAPGVVAKIYHYGSPCSIKKTSGCVTATQHPEVVRIGVPGLFTTDSDRIGGLEFSFSLIKVDTIKKALTIRAVVRKPDKAKRVFEIEFRDSNSNMAHMDADGKVRQSNPNPNDFCKDPDPQKRLPYSELTLFDESNYVCKSIGQLGGGTGLTYYHGRYFAFRPADGQVFDLKEASDPASPYLQVSEAGFIGSTQVFPPYSKEALFNAEDTTIIEDQIYYVRGQSNNAAIYALVDPSDLNNHSVKVCDLGSQGWGQAYVGLASKAWSDRLLPLVSNSDPKIATFYLKTFSGDLLTALVWSVTATTFQCIVLKDSAIQQDENKRTYGFDKVVTDKAFGFW
jgi:hypothetical protein